MKDISHLFTGITKNVYDYVNTISEIKSKKIIDIPAGDGRLSAVCKELGASVDSYDIQTGDNKYINQEIKFCDMNNILPIKDNYADIIICQEGIEHLPNQYFIFREFNRILKLNGLLILTTPSISSLRSKLSYLFTESENLKKLPYSKLDSIWMIEKKDPKSYNIYFGHLFLITASKLFTLTKINGFNLEKNFLTKISPTSLILFILLYPIIFFFNIASYIKSLWKLKVRNNSIKKKILKDHLKLNLSPKTLLSKHTFWVLKKELSLEQINNELSNYATDAPDDLKRMREIRK